MGLKKRVHARMLFAGALMLLSPSIAVAQEVCSGLQTIMRLSDDVRSLEGTPTDNPLVELFWQGEYQDVHVGKQRFVETSLQLPDATLCLIDSNMGDFFCVYETDGRSSATAIFYSILDQIPACFRPTWDDDPVYSRGPDGEKEYSGWTGRHRFFAMKTGPDQDWAVTLTLGNLRR